MKVKTNRVYLCAEGDREETAFRRVNNGTVYPLAEDPDVPQPSQHHQDVRVL